MGGLSRMMKDELKLAQPESVSAIRPLTTIFGLRLSFLCRFRCVRGMVEGEPGGLCRGMRRALDGRAWRSTNPTDSACGCNEGYRGGTPLVMGFSCVRQSPSTRATGRQRGVPPSWFSPPLIRLSWRPVVAPASPPPLWQCAASSRRAPMQSCATSFHGWTSSTWGSSPTAGR